MIIPDDTPASPLKDNFNRLPQQQEPPPSYGATQSQAPFVYPDATQQNYHSAGPVSGGDCASRPLLQHPQVAFVAPRRRGREGPARRFCKAFCVALLIWAVFSLIVSSLSLAIHIGHRSRGRRTGWDDEDLEVPNNVALRSCIKGSEMKVDVPFRPSSTPQHGSRFPIPEIPDFKSSDIHLFQTSFDLPLSSNLFLIARGALSSGEVTFVADSELSGTDVARVDLELIYPQQDLLDKIQACLIERPDGSVGIGLFSPRTRPNGSYKDWVFHEVTVRLPYPSAFESHLRVDAFETDLPNFSHVLGSLREFVEFGRLDLKGSNGKVMAESLKAVNTSIHTTNSAIDIKYLDTEKAEMYTSDGPISGYYNVSGALDLRTSNAPIKSDIDLYSSKGKGKLSMYTKNSKIESNINFLASYPHESPEFTVSTTTSNGKVDLYIDSLPLHSPLYLNTKTSNNEVKVYLPATYEGTYALSTTNDAPVVYVEHQLDPEGKRRRRQNRISRRIKGALDGEVFWEEGNRGRGNVKVTTTNGGVEVHV